MPSPSAPPWGDALPLGSCSRRRPQHEQRPLGEGGQARARADRTPAEGTLPLRRGGPSPSPGTRHCGLLTARAPRAVPHLRLTPGLAEQVVVPQAVAGRAAAVAPVLLLQAIVRAAAVLRRAVGEASLCGGPAGGRRESAALCAPGPAPGPGELPGPPPAAPHLEGRSGPPSPARSRSGSRPGRRCTCRVRSTGCRTGAPAAGPRTGPRLRRGVRRGSRGSAGPVPVPPAAQRPRGARAPRPGVWSALTVVLGPEGHLRREGAASGALSPPM